MDKLDENELAVKVADAVNNMSFDNEAFCKAMENEHRTLQQNFTRLAVTWLLYCARDEYRTDLRNEDTKTLAKEFAENCTKGLRYV